MAIRVPTAKSPLVEGATSLLTSAGKVAEHWYDDQQPLRPRGR